MTKSGHSRCGRRGEWLKLMQEGQLTRDRVLKTREETERDRAAARAVAARRQRYHNEATKGSHR